MSLSVVFVFFCQVHWRYFLRWLGNQGKYMNTWIYTIREHDVHCTALPTSLFRLPATVCLANSPGDLENFDPLLKHSHNPASWSVFSATFFSSPSSSLWASSTRYAKPHSFWVKVTAIMWQQGQEYVVRHSAWWFSTNDYCMVRDHLVTNKEITKA